MEQLKRVLYVDDDPSICELVELAFEISGDIELRICHCGEEALGQIEKFDAQLVVIDVNMPNMDGPETINSLGQKGFRLPVVFATAETRPEIHQQLLSLGSLDVLVKPFDPLTLRQRLCDIWDSSTGSA
jgi:CheY-like chemotaxis protein